MHIKDVKANPYPESIEPAIKFSVIIDSIRMEEAILYVYGFLETVDGKLLAEVIELPRGDGRTNPLGMRGSAYDDRFKREDCHIDMISILNNKIINYIEKTRLSDPKRDVNLKLKLNVVTLVNDTRLAKLRELSTDELKRIGLKPSQIYTGTKDTNEWSIMATVRDPRFQPTRNDQYIIAAKDDATFLNSVMNQLDFQLTTNHSIKSSDWVHDFAPKLGIGEYFIVEIPKGNEIIKDAWAFVIKAEECFRMWDTKGAYANCREAGMKLNDLINQKMKGNPIFKKWKRAYTKFEHTTSIDLHSVDIEKEEPKGQVEIGMADVDHILIITKALIKYAEELMLELDK